MFKVYKWDYQKLKLKNKKWLLYSEQFSILTNISRIYGQIRSQPCPFCQSLIASLFFSSFRSHRVFPRKIARRDCVVASKGKSGLPDFTLLSYFQKLIFSSCVNLLITNLKTHRGQQCSFAHQPHFSSCSRMDRWLLNVIFRN